MSKLTHYQTQTFEDTGYTESACGRVLRDCDTTKNIIKVDCKKCLKKLRVMSYDG